MDDATGETTTTNEDQYGAVLGNWNRQAEVKEPGVRERMNYAHSVPRVRTQGEATRATRTETDQSTL